MTHLLLRALNAPAFVLLVMIGVALQSSLFAAHPLTYFQPDVVLLAVIWCALRRDFAEGGILTLIFADIAELHTSAPQGLFLISYMIIYLMMRYASRIFVIPNLYSLITVTLGASVVWKLTYLAILFLLGIGASQWQHTLLLLLPGAVVEGVAAMWIYRGLERFDWLTYKDPRARQTSDDEFRLDTEGL